MLHEDARRDCEHQADEDHHGPRLLLRPAESYRRIVYKLSVERIAREGDERVGGRKIRQKLALAKELAQRAQWIRRLEVELTALA